MTAFFFLELVCLLDGAPADRLYLFTLITQYTVDLKKKSLMKNSTSSEFVFAIVYHSIQEFK